MNSNVKSKPTMRRYSPEQKEQAVRMVLALRVELGTSQGTVKRVADQLGYGVEGRVPSSGGVPSVMLGVFSPRVGAEDQCRVFL